MRKVNVFFFQYVVSTLEGSMDAVELEEVSVTDSEILASDFSFE